METVLSKQIDSFFHINKSSRDNFRMSSKVIKGLPGNWIKILKTFMGISDNEIAELLGVNPRTISRINKESRDKLPLMLSDRLYRVFNIFYIAIDVFNDKDEAIQWLKTPQYGLKENIPLDLLKTEVGTKAVETELMRIEYGVY